MGLARKGEHLPQLARDELVARAAPEPRERALRAASPSIHMLVVRDGDRLFVQATGQQKLQLFAESRTRFFLKDVDAQISFGDGRLVLHQGGQDQVVRKIR